MNRKHEDRLARWFIHGKRGISSTTIVEVMEGYPRGALSHRQSWTNPHDPADFYRCLLLLDVIPEYKERLSEMKSVSPEWSVLVDHWEELREMLSKEFPTGKAPKTYNFMRRLFAGIEKEGK